MAPRTALSSSSTTASRASRIWRSGVERTAFSPLRESVAFARTYRRERHLGTYTYALSFRISHSKDDLSEIPSRLRLEPRVCWKKGEPRVTPTGRAIGGVRKDSYCLFELQRKKKNDLSGGLKRAV